MELARNKYSFGIDKDIKDIFNHIDTGIFKDKKLHDDYNLTDSYLKETYPTVYALFQNVWPIVIEKYIQPEFPGKDITVKHFRLVQGQTDGNTEWHNDIRDSDGNKTYQESNLIFLYYFNTVHQGPLCLRRDGELVSKIYPLEGSFVIINEQDKNIEHKIERYNEMKYPNRYVARIGFWVC